MKGKVVIDGSNVICANALSKGTHEVNGHRLISAIELYRSKGYEVIPCILSKHIWHMSVRNPHNEGKELPGYRMIKRLLSPKSSTKLLEIQQNDDLFIINIALDNDAHIVTSDCFNDHRKNHPDIDWPRVDKLTWGTSRNASGEVKQDGTWMVVEDKFIHPNLPQAPLPTSESKNSEFRKKAYMLEIGFNDLEKTYEKHSEDLKNHPHNLNLIMKEMRRLIRDLNEIPSDDFQIPKKKELIVRTKAELSEICIKLGIPKSGNKTNLIDRIQIERMNIESKKALNANKKDKNDNKKPKIKTKGWKYSFGLPENPEIMFRFLKIIESLRYQKLDWSQLQQALAFRASGPENIAGDLSLFKKEFKTISRYVNSVLPFLKNLLSNEGYTSHKWGAILEWGKIPNTEQFIQKARNYVVSNITTSKSDHESDAPDVENYFHEVSGYLSEMV